MSKGTIFNQCYSQSENQLKITAFQMLQEHLRLHVRIGLDIRVIYKL